ncbi:MAG: HEPN domain-containing protein [Myxococcota bacterium]|nr:HEPN domain-containing protein [Myxococcota bacterium]
MIGHAVGLIVPPAPGYAGAMREETSRWMDQARADLDAARKSLESGIDYLAAFLAHQAVEKALEALTIEKLRRMPAHTHVLPDLGTAIDAPEPILHLLRVLNPHYAVARYPDAANGVPARMYDAAIAGPLVDAAAEVQRWVTSELTGTG